MKWLLVVCGAMQAQGTTWREAATLLDRWCNACHRPGQAGPFDFTTYEGASAYAPEMARYIIGNKMPPWRAKPGPLAFANSRRLPDEVIAKLLGWINAGANHGPEPMLPKRHPLWNQGAPDLVLSQAQEFTVSAEKTVEIVALKFSAVELGSAARDRFVQAIEFRPSNRNLLHHAVLSTVGKPLAAWAMCDNGIRLPAGVAWRLPKGQPLRVELHYFKRNLRAARDLTRIGLYFAKTPPARVAELIELAKPDIRIPAGANLHPERTSFTVPEACRLHAILPVFQLLAADVRLKVQSRRDWFLWVEPFEHHVMSSYVLAQPMPLPKGLVIEAEAIYDNSAQNQYNPHKVLREVRFAENGLDETFRFWLTVSRPITSN